MFVDVVPIKRAALSWMVSSFSSVVGAALIQASGRVFHHTPDLCLVDGGYALGSQEVSYSSQCS